ncbi:KpsF/GutQ family sugar-phosphate isomerase [Occultella kanbiaonis]|uniref:KpsF/GutQ family sugar-phosphate isomerase n=1 Tax=Occultella kanbiaonis TaxID=2675754 RepID=UPI001B355616|nr:SIS domain-containing protein [Occultella kanbiaonis]
MHRRTERGTVATLADAISAAHAAMLVEARSIARTADRVQPALAEAITLIHGSSGRVLVSGLGKSGHIAQKIAATLTSTGTPAQFVHAGEALHGDSGAATPADVAILISNSGETAEVCQFAHMLTGWGVPIIAMTRNPDSPLAFFARVVLDISVDGEADPLGLAPTASTASTLAVGDALAIALMTLSGFTPAQFAERHPGGTLGHQLLGTAPRQVSSTPRQVTP